MNFRHLLAALLLTVSNWAVAVTLTDGGLLPVTTITINDQPGDHSDPHVDGDLVVYSYTSDPHTDFVQQIRYYRFSTGIDAAIPNALPDATLANDLLGDVNEGRIIFTRIFPGRTAIMLFDTATGTLSDLTPAPTSLNFGSAIGGQTVAYDDYAVYGPIPGVSKIVVLDLATSVSTMLTNGTADEGNPAVSPDGNVVTWERCVTVVNCDIYSATRSGSTWTVQPVSATAPVEANSDTNGTQIVFERYAQGWSDIVVVPVNGGAETVLEIPGLQYSPSIHGQVVAFQSRAAAADNPDIYIADLANNRYFQITNTALLGETLNDVTVLPTGEVRLVWRAAADFDLYGGNIYAATFRLPPVVVADSTPPVLAVPANIAVDATSPAGAVVSYVATATDAVDPNPVVSCTPASGSTFPVGTTAVTCTATDASGNRATAGFSVAVFGAPDQVADLIDLVNSFNLRQGIENSLDAKLRNALGAAGAGNAATACNVLGAFINEVQAQSGKAITPLQASLLIAAANRARASLGCG